MGDKKAVIDFRKVRKDCFGFSRTRCSALNQLYCGQEGKCDFYKPKSETGEIGYELTCKGCGKPFILKNRSDTRKYCSRSCYEKIGAHKKRGKGWI